MKRRVAGWGGWVGQGYKVGGGGRGKKTKEQKEELRYAE